MSDRVARLAELRRKRKAVEGDEGSSTQETNDKVNKNTESEFSRDEVNQETKVSKDRGNGVSEVSKEEGSETKGSIEIQDPTEIVDSAEIIGSTQNDSKVTPEDSSESSGVSAHGSVGYSKHAYNSDLKEDLAVYLNRAHSDTQSVINRYIQSEYRKNVDEAES